MTKFMDADDAIGCSLLLASLLAAFVLLAAILLWFLVLPTIGLLWCFGALS